MTECVRAGIVVLGHTSNGIEKKEVYKCNCNSIVTSRDNTAMYIAILTNFEDRNPSLSNEVHRLIPVQSNSLPAFDTCTENSFYNKAT